MDCPQNLKANVNNNTLRMPFNRDKHHEALARRIIDKPPGPNQEACERILDALTVGNFGKMCDIFSQNFTKIIPFLNHLPTDKVVSTQKFIKIFNWWMWDTSSTKSLTHLCSATQLSPVTVSCVVKIIRVLCLLDNNENNLKFENRDGFEDIIHLEFARLHVNEKQKLFIGLAFSEKTLFVKLFHSVDSNTVLDEISFERIFPAIRSVISQDTKIIVSQIYVKEGLELGGYTKVKLMPLSSYCHGHSLRAFLDNEIRRMFHEDNFLDESLLRVLTSEFEWKQNTLSFEEMFCKIIACLHEASMKIQSGSDLYETLIAIGECAHRKDFRICSLEEGLMEKLNESSSESETVIFNDPIVLDLEPDCEGDITIVVLNSNEENENQDNEVPSPSEKIVTPPSKHQSSEIFTSTPQLNQSNRVLRSSSQQKKSNKTISKSNAKNITQTPNPIAKETPTPIPVAKMSKETPASNSKEVLTKRPMGSKENSQNEDEGTPSKKTKEAPNSNSQANKESPSEKVKEAPNSNSQANKESPSKKVKEAPNSNSQANKESPSKKVKEAPNSNSQANKESPSKKVKEAPNSNSQANKKGPSVIIRDAPNCSSQDSASTKTKSQETENFYSQEENEELSNNNEPAKELSPKTPTINLRKRSKDIDADLGHHEKYKCFIYSRYSLTPHSSKKKGHYVSKKSIKHWKPQQCRYCLPLNRNGVNVIDRNANMIPHLIIHHCKQNENGVWEFQHNECHKKISSTRTCFICSITAIDGIKKAHMTSVHQQDVETACRICEKDFVKSEDQILHWKEHHVSLEMPYWCPLCDARSSFRTDIIDHFSEVHSKVQKVLCPLCLNAYECETVADIEFLESHILKHRNDSDSLYHCVKCTLNFVNEEEYAIHHRNNHSTLLEGDFIKIAQKWKDIVIVKTKQMSSAMVSFPVEFCKGTNQQRLWEKLEESQGEDIRCQPQSQEVFLSSLNLDAVTENLT